MLKGNYPDRDRCMPPVSPPTDKICPTCGTRVPVTKERCLCGATLAPAAEPPPSSAEVLVQAEILYENYLSTRLQQARKMLDLTRLDQGRDPYNSALRERVSETRRVIAQLEVQLSAQTQKVREAKHAAHEATKPAAAPAHGAESPAGPISAQAPDTFRAIQTQRAEQIAAPVKKLGGRPREFISREEINALREPSSPRNEK